MGNMGTFNSAFYHKHSVIVVARPRAALRVLQRTLLTDLRVLLANLHLFTDLPADPAVLKNPR